MTITIEQVKAEMVNGEFFTDIHTPTVGKLEVAIGYDPYDSGDYADVFVIDRVLYMEEAFFVGKDALEKAIAFANTGIKKLSQ